MFLNLWSKPRNEQAMQEKFRPSSPPHSPMVHATPFLNKMKRKRDDSSPVSPRLEAPPLKKRTETMSHVEIPAFSMQTVAPASHATQTAEPKAPLAPFKPAPLKHHHGNASRQLNGVNGQNTQDSSVPTGTPATVMNADHDTGSQGSISTHSPPAIPNFALVKDLIEGQFSQEILLKHRELRLIDQELAKCQIALEQLRRCQVIPFPATSSSLANMVAVSSGSGAVYDNSAPHAPSWGVTNGPYTQHYARWLLQDPAFDDTISDAQDPSQTGPPGSDRATRGSRSEKSTIGSKSRTSRGTNNARLTALPDGYPTPKEDKGPCKVVRASDNKTVILVCIDCRRSNFNSAQGFINHCRIAHKREFASHHDAIEQSGEECDDSADGAFGDVGGTQGTASAGLVHPLVRVAFSHSASISPSAEVSTPPSSKKRKATSTPTASAAPSVAASVSAAGKPIKTSTPPSEPRIQDGANDMTPQVPFTSSPQTPHLSAMLAKLGKGVDLEQRVTDAKTKPEVDLSQSDDDDEEDDTAEDGSESIAMVKSHSTRGVMRSHVPADVNTSSTRQVPFGTDGSNETPSTADFPSRHPAYPSLYSMRPSDTQSQADTSMVDIHTPLNLSPNTTDPHPAPSLVSDDGDYENMHSDTESPSDVGDERDPHSEPEVMDHDDLDLGGEGSGLNLGHAKEHHHHHGPPAELVAVGRRSRPSTATNGVGNGERERHVSFTSPSHGLRRGPKAKDLQ